jgi:hypothetical protein
MRSLVDRPTHVQQEAVCRRIGARCRSSDPVGFVPTLRLRLPLCSGLRRNQGRPFRLPSGAMSSRRPALLPAGRGIRRAAAQVRRYVHSSQTDQSAHATNDAEVIHASSLARLIKAPSFGMTQSSTDTPRLAGESAGHRDDAIRKRESSRRSCLRLEIRLLRTPQCDPREIPFDFPSTSPRVGE